MSGHYYGNAGAERTRSRRIRQSARVDMQAYRASARAGAVAEAVARERVSEEPRRVPADRAHADAVPCAARQLLHRSVGRRVSVHHLLEADRPPARDRHAARADLERAETAQVQREIWKGHARSAGRPARRIRASSATRWPCVVGRSSLVSEESPATTGDRPMNVTCFTDAVTRSRLDRAVDASCGGRRVGRDCGQAGSAEHRRRHRAHPTLRRARSSSSSGSPPTERHDVAAGSGATRARATAAAAKGRRSAARSLTSTRRSRCSSMPTDRTIPRTSRCSSSRSWPSDADHVVGVAPARRIERAARRLRRVPAAGRQLVHHRLHQLAVRRVS